MMIAANIPSGIRYRVARKACELATKLDGLLVKEVNGVVQSRYKHMFGQNPSFSSHLRIFGEAGVVTLKQQTQSKLANRGETCLFVGYAEKHTGDTYEMWNPVTGRVHLSRDIRWLNRMFYSPRENPEDETET
eukprot:scaffold23492_cov240-Cylindrotheca_fusiformis.AAC.1